MAKYDLHAVRHSAMAIPFVSFGLAFNSRLQDASAVISASNEAAIVHSEVAQAPQTSMGAALKTSPSFYPHLQRVNSGWKSTTWDSGF